jgi:PPOX class probable F420-dependent enzyme
MPTFNTTTKKLLASETIIWLTTVGSDLTPQPRPVWFAPDGDNVLIYSQPKAAKVAHIRKHPNVALHFNADQWGSDETIVVLTGTATLEPANSPQSASYIKKYKEDMAEIGMTPEQFAASYSISIRVKITNVRGG